MDKELLKQAVENALDKASNEDEELSDDERISVLVAEEITGAVKKQEIKKVVQEELAKLHEKEKVEGQYEIK